MQCLYCGKPLGLLKELTDGEFCSSQHRQRYKKLTRLALSRLQEAPCWKPACPPPVVPRDLPSWRGRLRQASTSLTPVVGAAIEAERDLSLITPLLPHERPVLPVFRMQRSAPMLDVAGVDRACHPVAHGPLASHPVCADFLAFRPPAANLSCGNLALQLLDSPLADQAANCGPCLIPVVSPPLVRRGAQASVAREGAPWQWQMTRPCLPASSGAGLDSLLPAAAFQASRPPLQVLAAQPAGASDPAPFRTLPVHELRMPSSQPAPFCLALKAEDPVMEEVVGSNAVAGPVRLETGLSLGMGSALPALSPLFRYGGARHGIPSLPYLAEALAPKDQAAMPAAYMEMPVRPKRLALPRSSSLRIVETFEYLRPMEEPGFDWLYNLVSLWRRTPGFVQYAAAAACLMLMLWGSSPASGLSKLAAGSLSGLREGVQKRAAVELSEDFREGMTGWEGADNWARSWRVTNAGYARPGKLALYQPSMNMQDYRLEFLAQIEQEAVSWVYRAADQDNYYAAKITMVEPGPLPLVALVRYPVLGGKPGPRVEIPIRVMMHNNTPYRVQLTVKGADFTASIEGQLVDFWRDDRLKTGGVGFFSDTGERARIYWMNLSHQDDFVGRVCAYFYPNPMRARSVERPQ
jgi:hypothetical protein